MRTGRGISTRYDWSVLTGRGMEEIAAGIKAHSFRA